MSQSSLPNIFEYNDFRRFLDDYQRARQAIEPGFTRSYICKRLGIAKSRSYFGDVVAGKFVSSTYVTRFIRVLGLNREEAQFFRVLVNFNQAVDDPDEREMYFGQLISLNRTPTRVVDRDAYEYYKEWRHGAIRALLDIGDFNGDYRSLARKLFPPITPKQVRESLRLLDRLGLIARNAQGYYKPTERSISTGPYVKDEIVKQYQLKCLELARRAILENRGQPQYISTRVVGISEQGLKRIEKRVRSFSAEIRSMVHKDEEPADRVYHLDLLLYPNSR